MKVGIPRDDAADAMFAHEDRRVSVVEQIPREMGKLCDDLGGNFGVSLCGEEDSEAG